MHAELSVAAIWVWTLRGDAVGLFRLASCCSELSGIRLNQQVCYISDFEAMRSLHFSAHPGNAGREAPRCLLPAPRQLVAAAPVAGPVSERRLLQRVPTWPLAAGAAGRSPSANPPPACKRDMAARRAAVGRRAGVFLFLLFSYLLFLS
jgi:hypothetical protein